jgi:hypothetical protein
MNPWMGENSWREFIFDMRHPGQLWVRMKEGTALAWADWVDYFHG